MINDFQGVRSFVDYRHFGIVISVDACEIKYAKEIQDSSSGIYVFFNYEKVGVFKKKGDAKKFILKMIEEGPSEIRKESQMFEDYLLRSLK